MRLNELLLCCLIMLGFSFSSFSDQGPENPHQCACPQIGIDQVWADSSGVSCFRIPVHQKYRNAGGRQFYLAAIRAQKTGASSGKPLLYLHGGPGIASLENAERYLNSTGWSSLRKDHDIIMMDYRGTGFSEPALCKDYLDSLRQFETTNPTAKDYSARKTELYMKCRNSLPSHDIDIHTFSSFQMAADADQVREALNIGSWNIYGISYGTMVALLYIRHFPGKVTSAVLDSPFPPNAPGFDFIQTMNSALVSVQHGVRQDPIASKTFTDVVADFKTAADRLNDNPAHIYGRDFDGAAFAGAMVSAFYDTRCISLIPLALHEFASGNDSLLTLWVETLSAEGAYGMVNEIQGSAITCFECKPRRPDQAPAALEKAHPHLASLSMAEFMTLCSIFRPEVPEDSFFEPVHSEVPVLVMVGAYDPGTPPAFGEAAVQKLSNATLIVAPNASHAVLHSDDCFLQITRSFLQSPNLKQDLSCIAHLPKIKFATADLRGELTRLKEKQ